MTKGSDSLNDTWTIGRLIPWTTDYFTSHGIDSPRMTAEILLAHSLEISRIDLYLQYEKPLNDVELAGFKSLIKRRINREPVAYITGTRGFWSLDLEVTPHVLIPRPDTECLVEKALELIPFSPDHERMTILDLGTGSGAILLALAADRPGHRYIGVDLSIDAAKVAKNNKDKLVPGDDVTIINGSWFDMFSDRPLFDLIVSNPPYIPRDDIDGLEPEVRQFEPRMALDGDVDGLKSLQAIIQKVPSYLKDGAHLVMEMGYDQRESVQKLFGSSPFYDEIEFFKDYGGNDRVVKARKINGAF